MRLKFVEKIKETEREGSTGTSPSCWKPASAKKLTTTGGGFHFVIVTKAVCDSDHVDTRDVEEHKCYRVGWKRAGVADVVTELVGCAQLE